MGVLEHFHGAYIHQWRVEALCRQLAPLIPPHAHVLDVGCGDGLVCKRIREVRPDITVEGIDVLVRGHTHIPVKEFDGARIPFPAATFDVVLFVDVLHHVTDPLVLLREAARVARSCIILKDHTRNGVLANTTLRIMDKIGNARYGVALPYTYWSRRQWHDAFQALSLGVHVWKRRLRLYPIPLNWLFGRSLHFISVLVQH